VGAADGGADALTPSGPLGEGAPDVSEKWFSVRCVFGAGPSKASETARRISSELGRDEYLDAFFDTGTERQQR
jgi:hypothetical protein